MPAAAPGSAMEDASNCAGLGSGHEGHQQPHWAQRQLWSMLAAALGLTAMVGEAGTVLGLAVGDPRLISSCARLDPRGNMGFPP